MVRVVEQGRNVFRIHAVQKIRARGIHDDAAESFVPQCHIDRRRQFLFPGIAAVIFRQDGTDEEMIPFVQSLYGLVNTADAGRRSGHDDGQVVPLQDHARQDIHIPAFGQRNARLQAAFFLNLFRHIFSFQHSGFATQILRRTPGTRIILISMP